MLLSLFLLSGSFYAADWSGEHAACRPLPLVAVQPGGFLGKRIDQNLRSLLEGLKSPIPRRFEARVAGREPEQVTNRLASDSDLYKWMEGAAYTVARTRNAELAAQLDRIAGLVVACQQPDGYINTQVPPNQRFDPKVNHDLYIAGHFFEAAAAHYRATGKSTLVDAARRWADYLIREHHKSNPYFTTVGRREHSEYELGLLRLYRVTGEKRYLDFAMTLARMIPVTRELLPGRHAVRANYLLSGYADMYLETGADEWRRHLPELWDEIVTARSYVTGGIGTVEAYSKELYDLPQSLLHPSRDVAETCAAVSLMMFGWRLHSIDPQSHYFDRIETILYNHFLGAQDLDNLGTFYYNPVKWLGTPEGKTDHAGPVGHRTRLPAIHTCSCCIPNEWRFWGALSEYLFSEDRKGLYVNLYTSAKVKDWIDVETNYPHDGRVLVRVQRPGKFVLRLRIPAWCQSATLAVNKGKADAARPGEYAVLERQWQRGDTIKLEFAMPVRTILPDLREKANQGQAVLARGPLVYCLEQQDNTLSVEQARMNFTADKVKARWKPELLGGVHMLEAPGGLRFIPFYARANRGTDNRWVTFLPVAK